MLSLTDEVNDDWGFLKDFLGYKSHVRDSETGELTAPRSDANPQAVAASPAPHLGLHAPSQLTPPSPSHAVSPPQGSLSSPLAALSPASHVGTPLPSISTLVRYPPVSSPCVSGAPECLTPGHQVPPLTPEDGCRSLEAPPTPLGSIHDSQQFSDSDASCLVPSEGSAFRSVTPSGEIPDSKPSPSLLRDLLVLGKPPRSQHDQGRLGSLVRSGEMERWQEVVQYLGLPNPHHTQAPHTPMAAHSASPTHAHGHGPPLHHPHALYPPHDASTATPAAPVPRGVLLNNATLPPPMSDPMSHNITYTNSMASSHLVTTSMNLTNNSDLAGSDQNQYKMEANTSLPSEMMYYQNSSLEAFMLNETTDAFMVNETTDAFMLNETTDRLISDVLAAENTSTEMNQTTDGLLSSILNDEALGLMEMAMNDSGCVLPQLGGEEGVDASSDSAVSSLSPDETWGTVDHTTRPQDNGSRNQSGDYSAGSYRYGPEDPHRMPPVPLKKQHMFGRDKRYFHDNLQGATGGMGGGSSAGVGDVGGYGGHYPPPGIQTMEGATALDPAEMKYSCTMDFRSQGEVSGSGVEHVQHNHTYHMSPEGPSGLSRPTSRDKQKNRKNEHDRALTRDEKRARAMNLPITCEDIINLPMDEFNERISKYDLTEAQLSLIRDIRRRGKNKVAAQNCRKRKLDQILHLADEVKAIQNRKNELYNEYEYLSSERTRIKHKFSLLYRHIFQSLRDPDGNPYSPHEYSLQQSADGSILLVPRSSTAQGMDPSSSNKPRGKDDPKQ
ncbi:segmentation protein cap'n'collar-like isoform X1 [Penaeus chinensis]|uniref:segmentation protein cap'n'collar-like isoform X1 n=1 Tax=Penaeus chinensis TaxID=139456 RepID=UPI001FB759EA|nr:segmentation protein cap'n'collar-like isoform X1 [Penaeus chinensis]